MGRLRSILAVIAVLLPVVAPAQKKASEDSLVRLLRAERAQVVTEYGVEYRRVTGDARFLHNNTTLLCDSASWNLSTNIIEAFGHVHLKQERTDLSSDELTYYVDSDLAEFRGELVELVDKDCNTLRTRYLDYNTKDSVARFQDGGALRDKDGNVIESTTGTYDSKIRTFVFEDDAKLYMDSILLRSECLTYLSDSSKAVFGPGTHVWMDNGFVKADSGWYDKKDSVVFFADNVYCKDDDYESWSDRAWYFSREHIVEMHSNVRVLDSARHMVLMGNKLRYERDSSLAYLLEEPAVVHYGADEKGVVDTLFMRADSLIFRGVKKCAIPQAEIDAAASRRQNVLFDALQELRTKQYEERRKKIEDGLRAAGKLPPIIVDSTAAKAPADSTLTDGPGPDGQPADSTAAVAAPPDTTEVRTFYGLHNFKMYRSDLQAVSDSASFTTLDSIVVLSGRPVMWSSEKTQLTSEVMHLLVKDGGLYRGSMLYDSRLVSMETPEYFNQIRSTEMMGFFRRGELYRFDALGSVSAIIYMEENGALANVNLKEAKSMTAMIKNKKVQRMLYLDEIKSDAYPILELAPDRQRLKGFEWRGEERPASRFDITGMVIPQSVRAAYQFIGKPVFSLTDEYFDGYMTGVYEDMRVREEEARLRREEEARRKDSLRVADSLKVADSIALAPAADSLHVADSLAAVKTASDSLNAAPATDSSSVGKLSARERREARRIAKQEKRKARIEAREARRKARLEAREARRKARLEARQKRKMAQSKK